MSLLAWNPGRSTLLAGACCLAAIGLSLSLIPLADHPALSVVVRDLLQITVVGVFVPLWYFTRSSERPADFGLSLRRWPLFLAIDVALAGLLLGRFIQMQPPPPGFFDDTTLWRAGYVFLAVTFELLFFYAFLRTLLERAFGTMPGLVLVALIYSLHHAGFQPEFGKLFLVGLGFATLVRLGKSVLVIYPFTLGVGGIYDVLLRSKVATPIVHAPERTVVLAVVMLGACWWLRRISQRAT